MTSFPDVLIDITMTAARRPEVLKKTLHSFYKNCFHPLIDKCRLIINVDPVGENIPSYDASKIVSGFFKHYTIGLPMTASFPKAFRWTWAQSEAPWVFHLEDDWELLDFVNIFNMIKLMQTFPRLAALRLPYFDATADTMKNWNLFFPWNGHYFECPRESRGAAGFAGHPSLLRGDFVRHCVPLLNDTANPEKQFHVGNLSLIAEVLNWEYGVYSKPDAPKIIKDLGALWKQENQFIKKGAKAYFTEWEKIA